MTIPYRPLAAAFALASFAVAQTPEVAYRDQFFVNPTKRGAFLLQARVFYPATVSGWSKPVLAKKGGHPVVVFLSGHGTIGNDYVDLAVRLAQRGYIAIMSNTPRIDLQRQFEDGWAFYSALLLENRTQKAFFEGALNPKQIGIAGHSRGGFTALRILADNPGYRAGAAFAPWPGSTPPRAVDFTPHIKVPFAVVVGSGDKVTPWKTGAQPVFDTLKQHAGVKFLYLLDWNANHANVISWTYPGANSVDRQIFNRATDVVTGFLDRYLDVDANALERVAGKDAMQEPRLRALMYEANDPAYWHTGAAKTGGGVRLKLAGRAGFFGHFLSAKRASTPTPFGTLEIDFSTSVLLERGATTTGKLAEFELRIPNDATLRGMRTTVQGLAVGRNRALRLSNAFDLVIE